MDLNTCYETTKDFHTIATYSHLLPTAVALFLGFYLFFKAKFTLQSKAFLMFSLFFSLWLLGDLVTWLSPNYNLVVFFWGQLDNINIIFYALAAYFVLVTVRNKDASIWEKIFLGALTLPGFYITITGGTVANFDQASCNVINSDFLTTYKLWIEFICIAYIMIAGFIEWERNRKSATAMRKLNILTVTAAFVLFLSAFGITEFLSSTSDSISYTVSLYGLFILPVFLFLIILSIVRFETFQVRRIGVQLLVCVMIIMIGTQFLFLENSTNIALNCITLALAVCFGYLLLRNINSERRYTDHIEQLATELEVANKQQENLLHFISHEIKGYLAKSQAGFAGIVEGDYGAVSPELMTMANSELADVRKGVKTVMDILEASNLKKGTVVYSKETFDLKDVVAEAAESLKKSAEEKHLALETSIAWEVPCKMSGDKEKISDHVIRNLIDNAIKYTPAGTIKVKLARAGSIIRFVVEDNGVGITPEDMARLFTEGGHGKDSIKINVHSTGYGLFIAKTVVDAIGGKIWAESEGAGKGSRFIVEFPAAG